MSDLDALMAVLRANPADRLCRVVLADAVQEAGDWKLAEWLRTEATDELTEAWSRGEDGLEGLQSIKNLWELCKTLGVPLRVFLGSQNLEYN